MISWFTRNGVAANLLMFLLVLGGLASYFFVKRELFPQFSLDTIIVRVPYPGASPEEVEDLVVIRIEEAIQGIDGIKEINSSAQENYGSVSITIDKGYEISKVKDEVKTRVDAIITFPEDTEKPIIEELLIQKDVIRISVFGDTDEGSIKRIAERIRDDVVAIDGISQAIVEGVRDYEISIEVSEETLRNYGLTLQDVSNAVRANSLDVPGGLIKSSAGEIQVRSKEQAYRGEEFANIVLLSGLDGTEVRIGDIATITDGFAEQDIKTRFNGKPAAMILVREVGNEDPLVISKLIYEYVEEAKQTWIPAGIELEPWSDSSFYLQGRIDMLLKNGFFGFLLVLLVLAIFLRPTLAFFVAIGIPVSFLATLAIGPFVGITINLLSLFAFILVLGIVVDDAIVVGESVFTEFQKNGPSVESAIIGSHRVSVPVIFAVITTMVAFVPIFFLPGTIGKFMGVIPWVVMATLMFSLVQSKLILPYHLTLCSVGDKTHRSELNILSRLQRALSDRLERFVSESYAPFIRKAIKYRYTTTAAFIGALILSIAIVIIGWIRFVFFPSVPSDYIFLELQMAEGNPLEQTEQSIGKIKDALQSIRQEAIDAGEPDPVKNEAEFIGYSVISGGPNPASTSSGSNIGSVILELSKSELRDSNANEVADDWRDRVGSIPGARKLTFISNATGPVGLTVDIQLTGHDIAELRAASLEIQYRISEFEGLYDIRDTSSEGKRELKIRLKESARTLGLNAFDLSRQIRNAFYGAEAQRVQREGEDVKVMIRYPREERESLDNLNRMRIALPSGDRVPISEVAEIEMGIGYSAISRQDQLRTIRVQADANKETIDAGELNASLYGTFISKDPDLREKLKWLSPFVGAKHFKTPIIEEISNKFPNMNKPIKGGEAKDMEESMPAIIGGTLLVIALIYTLLAIPFKSYIQPLIVICVIPFGIGGAIFGHFITRQELSLLSILGIIALSGVVVNDSLVLVDRINTLKRDGMSLKEAVIEGGKQRFRAIMLTSVTTFVGLIPILLERSLQAQFLIPMATSLAFGVLFATFITLILVPCAYLILEDIQHAFSWWWRGLTGKTPKAETSGIE